jgi:hypothetical protein
MDEINRVARMMVDAEPAPDLAARIRARLDEVPAAQTSRRWGGWHVAAGLAAAAALTLAVLTPKEPGSRVPSPESRVQSPEVKGASLAVAKGEGGSPNPQAKAGPGVPRSTSARRQSASRELQTRALSAEELAWMERRMPALDPVVALQMDRLATDSIQPEALAITPLTMTALPTTSADAERRIR